MKQRDKRRNRKRDLSGFFPDLLTGRRQEMEQRFRSAYASGSADSIIVACKSETARYYLLLVIVLLLSGILIWQGFTVKNVDDWDLARDGYGGDIKVLDAEVTATSGDAEVTMPVRVKVLPKTPKSHQIPELLEDLKERLPAQILGENKGADRITGDLNLPSLDKKTGIDITWRCDREDIIDEKGTVNLLNGKAGTQVKLTADLRLEEAADQLVIPLTMGAADASFDLEPALRASVQAAVEKLNAGEAGDRAILPASDGNGLALHWRKPKDLTILFLPAMIILLFFLVFHRRYARIDKGIKVFRESISREFPEFLGKLLLLINAGMVVTGAVGKITADYKEHRRNGEEKPFYEELCGITDRMHGAGTTLTAEFSDMASRSGQREIMRFSAILADNIDKGSALAEKLTQENDMLWNLRKKRAEEKGRLAETKLTFPMVIQLLVVILITVAPAAFEMS